jgi:hypothetical protein
VAAWNRNGLLLLLLLLLHFIYGWSERACTHDMLAAGRYSAPFVMAASGALRLQLSCVHSSPAGSCHARCISH